MGRIPKTLRLTIAANIRACRMEKFPCRVGGKKILFTSLKMIKELEGEVQAALLDLGDVEYLHGENTPRSGRINSGALS